MLWKSVEIVIGFRRRRVSREWHAFHMFDSVVQESDGRVGVGGRSARDPDGGACGHGAAVAGLRAGQRATWEFTETRGCVRVVSDGDIDGRWERTGCEEGEEACHRCEGQRGAEKGSAR